MNTTTLPASAPAPAPLSVFERYLSVWVLLCIATGSANRTAWPAPPR